MNQILSVKKENNKKQKMGISNVVRIFAISIIVFAVLIIVIVGSSIYRKNIEDKENAKVPNIVLEQQNNKIKILVSQDGIIERVLYNWNDGETFTLYGMGNNQIEEYIDLIEGTNILNVTVIEANGKETSFNKEFVVEGIDLEKPEIEMILEGVEVKIVAKDNEELSSLKYSINNGEQIEVPLTGEDNKQMETRISINKGENTVLIVATDKNGNETVKTQTFKGATKSKIELFKDGGNLIVVITDEEGIKDIECRLNEQVYTKEINDVKVEFTCPLSTGVNVVKIKVTNISGLVTEADASCEYNP